MDLSYYGSVLRRRWKLVLLGILVGVGAAFAVLAVQPERATSWVEVDVNPIADNAFSSSRPASDLLVPETEQAMARSTRVVDNVVAAVGGDLTATEVRANMVATLLADSTVLRIDYTAATAREAADGALLVAQEYLDYRSSVAQERIDQAAEQLGQRRRTLDGELREANQQYARAAPGSPARAAADARRQSISGDLTSVNSQVNQLRAISTSGGTIISQPDPERAVLSPNRGMTVVSGVLGGLLLGLVLPFVGNVFDRRVRGTHDVTRSGAGPVVATLEDPTATVPAELDEADQLRALRERLLAAGASSQAVVAVTDLGTRTGGPTDVAANLAVAFADAGKETTLVLAGYPTVSFAQVVEALDLVETGYGHHSRYFHSRLVDSLTVVVPAPRAARVSDADMVATLLLKARRSAVTVVGVPAGGGQSVRLTAARLADHVVLAVAAASTKLEELSGVVTEFRAVGAVVHGTVLVPASRVLQGDPSVVPPAPVEEEPKDEDGHDGTDEEKEPGPQAAPPSAVGADGGPVGVDRP